MADFEAVTEEMLSAYLDDELSSEEKLRVEDRLEADAEFRACLEELQQLRDEIRRLPKFELPQDFATRVTASLESAPQVNLAKAAERSGQAAPRSGNRFRMIVSLASIAAMILVSLWAFPRLQPRNNVALDNLRQRSDQVEQEMELGEQLKTDAEQLEQDDADQLNRGLRETAESVKVAPSRASIVQDSVAQHSVAQDSMPQALKRSADKHKKSASQDLPRPMPAQLGADDLDAAIDASGSSFESQARSAPSLQYDLNVPAADRLLELSEAAAPETDAPASAAPGAAARSQLMRSLDIKPKKAVSTDGVGSPKSMFAVVAHDVAVDLDVPRVQLDSLTKQWKGQLVRQTDKESHFLVSGPQAQVNAWVAEQANAKQVSDKLASSQQSLRRLFQHVLVRPKNVEALAVQEGVAQADAADREQEADVAPAMALAEQKQKTVRLLIRLKAVDATEVGEDLEVLEAPASAR